MNKEQQKLVEDNVNLVYFIVNKYYPTYVGDEDIIQCGMVGLCNAAIKWDESKSKFSSYASKVIRNSIVTEIRKRKRDRDKECLSLDHVYHDSDGETFTLEGIIVGDEDVEYVNFDGFYNALSQRQKEILTLKQSGLSSSQIGEIFNRSVGTINRELREMRKIWGATNGN